MGSQEVVVSSAMVDASFNSCDGSPLHHEDDIKEPENLGANILIDLDLYLEDLNDRLTISRMVSNSFIKGMICAVEEEAKEKIQQKELELARLKQTLHLYHIGSDGIEAPETCCNQKTIRHGFYLDHDALLEHERSIECLDNLKDEAKKQFKSLKKEIDKIKGSSPIRRKNSASEMLGLGGILQDEVSEKWIDVDKVLDSLRTTLDSAHRQACNVVHISKSSLFEWQLDWEFQAEIEGMVTNSFFHGLRQEFEQRLWDQNVQCYGNKNAKLAKIKIISSLRQELDAISNSLSAPESGQLVSHRSLEQRKASGNHASSTTLWEGNGKHDHSIIVKPENLELAQLSHLSKEQLLDYFKTEMTKMKRHHESTVQQMTEEYFSLKGKYLKERGPLLVRKDKEFDTLRKKIPEIISKLDEILLENEKLPALDNNVKDLDCLKDKMELLYTKNCRLRDLLADKKKEIKFLTSQVYDAKQKISTHSFVKANLSKMIVDLNGAIEDAQIEASISEDIYKLLLKEVVGHIESFSQELVMGNEIMEEIYDIIFREAVHTVEPASKLEMEDSDAESIIMEGLYKIILSETLKEAMEKLDDLNLKYVKEKEIRSTLEMEVSEKEKAIGLSIEVREKLEHEILLLSANIDEKDRLLQQAIDALAKEKDKFKFASLELDKLRTHTNEQEMLISRCSEESQIIKTNLAEASTKIELYEEEICKLRERLELLTEKLKETAEEKSMLLVVSQEKQQLIEAKENEQRKQMDSISILAHGLSRAAMHFESKVTEDIERNSARLEYLRMQLSSLLQKTSKLKKIGLQYKQKLEKRCSDLQKAEAEVDLLGDEVDTLLSLLEKIYIALDHYSPILQHYPGITEILRLVRRELSGEAVKPV